MSVNSCTFIGNITRDAELTYLPSGGGIAKLGIACNETWKDKNGQKQEKVEFVNLIMFGKRAESLAQYLVKGKQIYVCGKLTTSNWEKDGVKHYRTEVNVQDLQFVGSKSDSQSQAKPQSQSKQPATDAAFTADSIPF